MTTTIAVAPVRKQVRVKCGPTRAFDLFACNMGRWWPKTHSLSGSPIEAVIIEPFAGGRWYERSEDRSECAWGKVIAWEPPRRLLLNWQLNTEWEHDPELTTELEIRFTPDGEGTLVSLEHRLEGFGAAAAQMKETFEKPTAWEAIMIEFAGAADAGA